MTARQTTAPIPVGAHVHYHGSQKRVHGLWQVKWSGPTYTLDGGEWGTLRGVRPESVTECGPDCVRCAEWEANNR